LGTSYDELVLSWEWQVASGLRVPTQDLGQAAFDCSRFQGIRFPAAKRGNQINLIVWTERIVDPAFVQCTDVNYPQRIP
jgi:hypothetical protein